MESRKFCVTFAGAVGSSKTPIAHYLSCKFSLPILSNDVIRTEVIEDLGFLNQEEYERRRDFLLREMMQGGLAFIYDASVDREWEGAEKQLKEFNYRWFIVSLDLSGSFLEKLCAIKGYHETANRIGRLVEEHIAFLEKCGDEVTVSISDETFKDRMELCHRGLERWLIKEF